MRPNPSVAPTRARILNCVVELATTDGPTELLGRCQELERQAERVRTVRWGPRTLDADVLLVGSERRQHHRSGGAAPPHVGAAVRPRTVGGPGS